MFEKLSETKVMRDPIHEYIRIDLKVIWDCIACKEFQRLRRIRQLGGTSFVYHTADHSRFSHSLGVYEVARRMITENQDLKECINEYDKVVVLLAGLLHDVGHGPFSHAFEHVSKCSHEVFTERIILEDSEINTVLKKVNPNLPKDVAMVINHTHPNAILTQLISGQLDADRMDYLLRDTYFTGTSYGAFDLERVIRTIRVRDGRFAIKESGIHAVEDYIMARYHMYWQVYFHPVSRSYEAIFTNVFKRLKDLYSADSTKMNHYEMFIPFLKEEQPSISDHFILDETACYYGFHTMKFDKDKILSDLAQRVINRNLFEYEDIESEKMVEEKKKQLKVAGYDANYYFYRDHASQRPYQPYVEEESSLIWVLKKDGTIKELSECSVIVEAIVSGRNKKDEKMFYPRGV